MRIEILQRLVMAKLLFKQGESLCNKRNDRYAFAMGLLALQDAVEMVLGVVAEHVQAKVSDKTRFPEYFNLIEEKDNDTPIKKWRTQLLKLNKIRVDFKHVGILPDLGSNAYFPSIVGEILDETCKVYFQDMLSSLSLKDAIKDASVRRLIDQAEQEITNRNFKQALEKLAEAFIKTLNSNELVQEVSKAPIFDTSRILYTTSVTVSEQTEEQPIEFQNLDNVNITLILVGMGLDVPLYLAFRTFIPQVGFNKQTGETVFNWDKLYAIEENWTEENAKLCHEFVIDAIIKLEKVLDQKIKLITYLEIFIEEIKAIKEEVDFVDELDGNPREYMGEESGGFIHGGSGLNYFTRLPKILFKLRQGEKIKGYTSPQYAPKGWTFVYSEEIREKCASKKSYAYVKSSEIEVKIIKRETTALSKGNLTEIPKEN